MRSAFFALALVGMTAAAVAAPPLIPPFSGPADVRVINAAANPVPVAITPGPLPTLAKIAGGTLTLDASGMSGENLLQVKCTSIDVPMRITGISVQSSGAQAHAVHWYLVLKPIGSNSLEDEVFIATGVLESKATSPMQYVNRTAITLPANVVTAGYDKLCIRGQRSGTFTVDLGFSAVGEAL